MKAADYTFKNDRAKKVFIAPYVVKIIGLVLLGISVVVLLSNLLKTDTEVRREKPYKEMLLSEDQGVNKVVSLDVEKGTKPVTIKEDGKYRYCFVKVGNEYFLVRMTEKQLDKLSKKLADSKTNVKVTGYTKKVNDELKTRMAPFIAENVPGTDAVPTTVTRYTGQYYTVYQKDKFYVMLFSIGLKRTKAFIILVVLGVLFLIVSKKLKKKAIRFAANSTVNYAALDFEMNAVESFWFDTLKVYATKNYLIGFGPVIHVIKYSNLVWIYDHQQELFKQPAFHQVKIMDVKGKLMNLSTCTFGNGRNGRITLEMRQLEENIRKHNENVEFGFSMDTKLKMQDMYQKGKK